MDKIILGRYLPGDSIIYRLDPRGKFLLTFYFVGIVFLANNVASYAFLLAFVLFAVYLSKINFGFFIRGLKPIFWLILFTVALQLFFTPSEHPIWHWGFLTFSKEGMVIAGYIFIRFVLIIFISTLLTLTTTPIEISDSIESILKPLKRINFPVTQVALMLSIALLGCCNPDIPELYFLSAYPSPKIGIQLLIRSNPFYLLAIGNQVDFNKYFCSEL